LEGFVEDAGTSYGKGAYLVKRDWQGSRGRVSGRGLGCGVGLAVVEIDVVGDGAGL